MIRRIVGCGVAAALPLAFVAAEEAEKAAVEVGAEGELKDVSNWSDKQKEEVRDAFTLLWRLTPDTWDENVDWKRPTLQYRRQPLRSVRHLRSNRRMVPRGG